MKELMIDYIDGRLSGELKQFVEKHIEKSATNKQDFEALKEAVGIIKHDIELTPDSSLSLDFHQQLEEEIEKGNTESTATNKISISFWQLAAAISLLLVGGLGAWLITKNNTSNTEISEIKNELQLTKKLVSKALSRSDSPSERLMAVSASYNLTSIDDEMIRVLVATMNEDENTNVRLAAINALLHFVDQKEVKAALVDGLRHQNDPLIQITLINLMVEMKEKSALDEINEIINDSTAVESVKDEAHMAVFKLS